MMGQMRRSVSLATTAWLDNNNNISTTNLTTDSQDYSTSDDDDSLAISSSAQSGHNVTIVVQHLPPKQVRLASTWLRYIHLFLQTTVTPTFTRDFPT